MTQPNINIRYASLCDAQPLASLAERTFRDAFADSNTPSDLDLHCKQFYHPDIQHQEILDTNKRTLLVEQEDRLLGYALLNLHAPSPFVSSPSPGEINRFYVDADYHGLGVAQTLMQSILDLFTADRKEAVWLGVWEHNPKAIAFYKKYDFEIVGDHMFPVGTDPQLDLIMSRDMT